MDWISFKPINGPFIGFVDTDLDLATPDGLVVVVVGWGGGRQRDARGHDPKVLHGRPIERRATTDEREVNGRNEDAAHFAGKGNGPETGFGFILDGLSLARSLALGKLCIHHVCPDRAWTLQKPVVCVSEVIASIYLEGQISPFLIFLPSVTQNLCSHLSEV